MALLSIISPWTTNFIVPFPCIPCDVSINIGVTESNAVEQSCHDGQLQILGWLCRSQGFGSNVATTCSEKRVDWCWGDSRTKGSPIKGSWRTALFDTNRDAGTQLEYHVINTSLLLKFEKFNLSK